MGIAVCAVLGFEGYYSTVNVNFDICIYHDHIRINNGLRYYPTYGKVRSFSEFVDSEHMFLGCDHLQNWTDYIIKDSNQQDQLAAVTLPRPVEDVLATTRLVGIGLDIQLWELVSLFVFVTNWDFNDNATIFNRYGMQLGRPTFVPVQDIEMGFEKIVKIAHCRGRDKMAKEDADMEIAQYCAQVEAEFQRKVAVSSGDSGANVKRLEHQTDTKIQHLKIEASRISQDVLQMLLKQVTTVKN
ncbi:hypothetical protein Q3G72_021729 [Acer saccharum]|nr:hypothetical protein Q3G72_021729 [Acer saccharum]